MKATGRAFTVEWIHLFTLEQGLVGEFKEYFDPRSLIAAYDPAADPADSPL